MESQECQNATKSVSTDFSQSAGFFSGAAVNIFCFLSQLFLAKVARSLKRLASKREKLTGPNVAT